MSSSNKPEGPKAHTVAEAYKTLRNDGRVWLNGLRVGIEITSQIYHELYCDGIHCE